MSLINALSWLAFLSTIPLTIWILWLKTRSSISCWIRYHQRPQRWMLTTAIPRQSSPKKFAHALAQVVAHARNIEWDASCVYRKFNKQDGNWIIGLISESPITSNGIPGSLQVDTMPAADVARLSGNSRHEHVTVQEELQRWAHPRNIQISVSGYSLSAQSFQCHEWEILPNSGGLNGGQSAPITSAGFIEKLSEKIFEMKDLALYPVLFTLIAITMCGTGSAWLFGVGIFTIILMSGACKFVFLHQREDATQEAHLQNY